MEQSVAPETPTCSVEHCIYGMERTHYYHRRALHRNATTHQLILQEPSPSYEQTFTFR